MRDDLRLGIHYTTNSSKKYYESAGVQTDLSAGFDLINVEDIKLEPLKLTLLSLGIVVKLPEGFCATIGPRSSTFKKYRIVQVNSVGLIDEDYCGSKDEWRMPVIYVPESSSDSIVIPAGTRIAQFMITPVYRFSTYEYQPPEESRGGFGSTGI